MILTLAKCILFGSAFGAASIYTAHLILCRTLDRSI